MTGALRRLVIAGGGGHGAEIAAYVTECGRDLGVEPGAVFDDDPDRGGFDGFASVHSLDELAAMVTGGTQGWAYITAVGDNAARVRLVRRLEGAGLREPWSCIHPRSWCGPDVECGAGTCLAPASIVTTRARVGRHCILNVKASVSHDCEVGDYCNINPGATVCGGVILGEGVYIGAGATVRENVTIGPWSVVGAGAVVLRDLPERVLAVGVPAAVKRELPSTDQC